MVSTLASRPARAPPDGRVTALIDSGAMKPRAMIVEQAVAVPMGDGTVLRTDLWRPADERPVPVILVRTPYGRRSHVFSAFLDPLHAATRGYATVIQDVRGRGDSEGAFEPFVERGGRRRGRDRLARRAAVVRRARRDDRHVVLRRDPVAGRDGGRRRAAGDRADRLLGRLRGRLVAAQRRARARLPVDLDGDQHGARGRALERRAGARLRRPRRPAGDRAVERPVVGRRDARGVLGRALGGAAARVGARAGASGRRLVRRLRRGDAADLRARRARARPPDRRPLGPSAHAPADRRRARPRLGRRRGELGPAGHPAALLRRGAGRARASAAARDDLRAGRETVGVARRLAAARGSGGRGSHSGGGDADLRPRRPDAVPRRPRAADGGARPRLRPARPAAAACARRRRRCCRSAPRPPAR